MCGTTARGCGRSGTRASPGLPLSSFAKGARNLLLQRLEQILQRAALVRLDKDLDWHAGKEMDVPQAGDLLGRQHDPDRVISLHWLRGVLLLFAREIGGHSR